MAVSRIVKSMEGSIEPGDKHRPAKRRKGENKKNPSRSEGW